MTGRFFPKSKFKTPSVVMRTMFILVFKRLVFHHAISQGIIIGNEMSWAITITPILLVAFFHSLKLFWATISLLECKNIPRHDGPNSSPMDEYHWHKFHVGVDLYQIRNEFSFSCLKEGVGTVILISLRSCMNLVNINLTLKTKFLRRALQDHLSISLEWS